MLRLFIEHDFNHKVLRGLKRRISDLDYITADHLVKREESDENHLEWCSKNSRIVISHDVNTFTDAANQRLKDGEQMFGLILVPQTMPIGQAIDELEIIILCSKENEYENCPPEHLPLRLT